MKPTLQEYKLPKNWSWTTIGELTIISSGGTPDRKNLNYYKGEIPWVKSGELNFNIITDTEEKISELAINNSSAKIFPKESILVALYGATVGKLAILGIEAASNQAVAGIITTKSLSNKYVYYYLQQNRDKLLKQRKGGAQPNISQNILSEFPIPIPNLQEQYNIVDKIEELFEELNQAEKIFTKIEKKITLFKQVILRSAFEGHLTKKWRENHPEISAYDYLEEISINRKKSYDDLILEGKKVSRKKRNFDFEYHKNTEIPTWAIAKLDKLISIEARVGWKGLKKEEYTTQGPLFLSVHSLNYGKYVEFKDAFHISEERYEESEEIKLIENDILLCKDGSGIGKVGIIKHLPYQATINSSLVIIRGNEAFIPEYLYYLFLGPDLQSIVNERISGSAIPHLFQKDIREFILKVPPLDEQIQIIQEIERRFTIAEKLQDIIQVNKKRIILFRSKILQNAFEGQFISQKSDTENIGLLLKKIKGEKAEYLQNKKMTEKTKPAKNKIMKDKKTIIEILEASNTPLPAEEVWLQSEHKDKIENFYAALKLIQDDIVSVKKGSESLLSLKK